MKEYIYIYTYIYIYICVCVCVLFFPWAQLFLRKLWGGQLDDGCFSCRAIGLSPFKKGTLGVYDIVQTLMFPWLKIWELCIPIALFLWRSLLINLNSDHWKFHQNNMMQSILPSSATTEKPHARRSKHWASILISCNFSQNHENPKKIINS